MGWVGYLGSFDFNRVLREYQRAVDKAEPGRIRSAAVAELVAECRQQSAIQAGASNTTEKGPKSIMIDKGVPAEQDCLSIPPEKIKARQTEVRERLLDRQKRAGRKLLLFSLFFVGIFLLFPPVIVYVFAVLFVKLFRSVKIVRNE